jgi:aspartate aminotransferase
VEIILFEASCLCLEKHSPLHPNACRSSLLPLLKEVGLRSVGLDDIEDGNLIMISGFSKEFAMTGWRLGYTIAPKQFTDFLLRLQDNTTTCPASFVQYAALAALTGARDWQKKMNMEYQNRRDAMIGEIKKIPNWKCAVPEGAFYCFPFVAKDSVSLSNNLLSDCLVSSVAGKFFGQHGESHPRLSYTTPKERIIEGMGRIREFVTSGK